MKPQKQEITPSPTLGSVLTRVRAIDLEMTQEEYAAFLHVKRAGIPYWELDQRIPTRATLLRLKDKLLPYLRPGELVVFEINRNKDDEHDSDSTISI